MTSKFTRRAATLMVTGLLIPQVVAAQTPGAPLGDPLTVELSGVALPVVRGDVLVNYLFSVIKIQLSDVASVFFLRENSFLLRDAIIKIASRSAIPAGATPNSFDRVAVTRLVLRAIQAIRPSARVVRVTVENAAFMRN